MRFFTKEWQEAVQNNASPEGFDIIKDREYSDVEIDELYQNRLDEFISNEREVYNIEPVHDLEFYDLSDLTIEDVLIVVLNSDGEETYIQPETMEEWKEYADAAYQENLQAFNEREEFNSDESREFFEMEYQMKLEYNDYLPDWVYDSMDNRLIALNYLTEDIYRKLERESELADEYIESVIEAYALSEEEEDIPEDILDFLNLHDANLVGIEEVEGDILLTVKPEHFAEDDEPEVLVFTNARFIEFEELNTEIDDDFLGLSPTFFIYNEVYNSGEGFDFHFLLADSSSEETYKYLTIYADDIYSE